MTHTGLEIVATNIPDVCTVQLPVDLSQTATHPDCLKGSPCGNSASFRVLRMLEAAHLYKG
jgi:hypothetical protein